MKFIFGLVTGAVVAMIVLGQDGFRVEVNDQLLTGLKALQQRVEPADTPVSEPATPTVLNADDLEEKVALHQPQETVALHEEASPDSSQDPDLSNPGPGEQADSAPVEVEDVDPRRFQIAWIAFHSEASASGFASRLSRQLSRDFDVVKTGPGRYEVGFYFDSVDEQNEVLDSITAITGFVTEVGNVRRI